MHTNRLFKEYCDVLKSQFSPGNRILLVQIPQFNPDSYSKKIARNKGYYTFPPTGLQYLYEAIKSRDLNVRILDLNLDLLKKLQTDDEFNISQWLSILDGCLHKFDPYIIGLSCMYDSGIGILIKILKHLRLYNRSIIISGGIIATYESRNLLSRDLCHFVIKGEGENKLNFLLDHITGENTHKKGTPGICFRYRDICYETKGAADIVIPSGNLIDSYSKIKFRQYHKYGSLNPFSRMAGLKNTPFATIQLNRGCRGACTFCSVRDFMGKGVRNRPVKDVLDEMEFLIMKKGVRHFEWLDDDLLYHKENIQLILERIIKRKWNISWSANNGLIVSNIDEKTMRLINDSGCIGFKIGIESGNPEILKSVNKPGTLQSFRRFSELSGKYAKPFIGGNFMIGFPRETFGQMMDSFRFFLEMNLDWGAFTICQAIRGATAFRDFASYFEEQMEHNGAKTKNFIPAREASPKQISVPADVKRGLDVFKIPPQSIPDEIQIKEIWETFNLVGNFINNKNLTRNGNVDKFIAWVETAQAAYPTKPYMSLFLSLAYLIKGNARKADEYRSKMTAIMNDYWWEWFKSFRLDKIIHKFPSNQKESFEMMESLIVISSKYYQ